MLSLSKRILLVDDDKAMLRLLTALFKSDYEVASAPNGPRALEVLPAFSPNLVMLDVMMPGLDGHETCRRIRSMRSGRGVQVMMVSAVSSRNEQDRAYQAGADDYVVKPFDPHELRARVRLHFRLREALDTIARAKPGDGSQTVDMAQLEDVAVSALTKMAEFRDRETSTHLSSVRAFSQILAEQLGREGPYADEIDERFLEDLYRASPLHDIGKVGVEDKILFKPGPLSPDEFDAMKRHTTIGANIVEHVAFGAPNVSFLRLAAAVARFHHERFDGGGYPAGLAGEEIPLPARIVALADAYDAITSVRPYKQALSAQAARTTIEQESGCHFDPHVVEAFRWRFPAIVGLQRRIQENSPLVLGAASFLTGIPKPRESDYVRT